MDWDDEAAPRGLDLPRLFAAVYQRKRWIILPTLAAFVCALAFLTIAKPRYTATAKVLLENGDNYFTRPDKALPEAANIIDEMTVESEAEAAKSPDVERQAMAKLTPEDRAEFADGGGLLSMFSGSAESAESRQLEAFGKHVDIYPQTKTRVLLFEFSSVDRARAARGANALAQAFLESQQLAKDQEAKSASQWLSQQIDALRAKVATAESRVEALRAQSGLLPVASGVSAPTQQLSEIAAQIASARAAQTAAATKATALRNMVRAGRLDDVASVANDESLRRYAESRVALKAQIAELSRTLLPAHPRMKELAGQLAGLEQEIRAAAMKRVHGFEEDAAIAENQVKSLQQAVANQARAVTSSDADQVRLRELEIDAKTARDQLESYLTKYREAMAREAENAVPANGRIIAYALTPVSPSFPKAGATLLLAPLAALFVSLSLVIAQILLIEGGGAAAPARPAPAPTLAPARRARARGAPFGVDPPAPARVDPPAPARADPPPASPGEPPAPDGVEAAAPPGTATRREESARERQIWTSTVEAFVDRLADASGDDGLSLIVAGEGATGALPAALVAARRLSRRGLTVLVDLSPSPSWLADTFDRERDGGGGVRSGLSELVGQGDGVAAFAHHDLSSALEIIPSGKGEVSPDDLPAVLKALSREYKFIVLHVEDWRSRAAARTADEMAAMLLVAPAPEIAAVEARARVALQDKGLAIKAVGVGPAPDSRERAA